MVELNRSLKAKKGDLVQVHIVVLAPDERAPILPEATRCVPYEGWIKGYLLDEVAEFGQTVLIESFIGRQLSGVLVDIHPIYDHNFGEPQSELNIVGKETWKKLESEA